LQICRGVGIITDLTVTRTAKLDRLPLKTRRSEDGKAEKNQWRGGEGLKEQNACPNRGQIVTRGAPPNESHHHHVKKNRFSRTHRMVFTWRPMEIFLGEVNN